MTKEHCKHMWKCHNETLFLNLYTHAHTHTHTLSLSLSLSLTRDGRSIVPVEKMAVAVGEGVSFLPGLALPGK
jgi:hypothetical protein